MSKRKSKSPRVLIAVVGALMVGGSAFGYYMLSLIAKPIPKSHEIVQVTVLKPPPPPPDQPPPPPPQPEEEVQIPDPQTPPEMPDEAAPSESLGVEGDGSAGSDAFGLAARHGGSDLVGGSGSRQKWFASKVTEFIRDRLAGREELKKRAFKVPILLWVSADGKLERFRVVGSAGDAGLDQALDAALNGIGRFAVPPPEDMPQPIRVRVEYRS